MTDTFVPCDKLTLRRQIGMSNILAISGGRIIERETGIDLPVRYGYFVAVDLAANETYTVRRMHKRGGDVKEKGRNTDVYCEQVGEVAYKDSCFRDRF